MEDFTPLPQESPEPYFNVGKLKVVSELLSLLRPPNTKTETSMITIDVRDSQSEICLGEKNCVWV